MNFPDEFVNPMEKSFQDGAMRRLFEAGHTVKRFNKGEMIYLQGDYAASFYYLKSGKAAIFLSSENGMEKTLAVQQEGSVFGEAAFFDGLPRMSSARAETSCQVIEVGRAALLEYFSRDPRMAVDMLGYLARTVRMLSAQVDNMAFLQADKRIAQLFVSMAGRQNPHDRIRCSHEDIGNMIGTSRVTVSRIMNRFVQNGWLRTGYRSIQIVDFDALYRFAFSE